MKNFFLSLTAIFIAASFAVRQSLNAAPVAKTDGTMQIKVLEPRNYLLKFSGELIIAILRQATKYQQIIGVVYREHSTADLKTVVSSVLHTQLVRSTHLSNGFGYHFNASIQIMLW